MEAWLKNLRNLVPTDRGVRMLVTGGTVLLFLIVLIDAFGSRSRAVMAMQNARAEPIEAEAPRASVPSVYRVPRDLASEAAAARAAETQLAEADPVEEPPVETAEAEEVAEEAEPQIAEADTAEPATTEPEEAEAATEGEAPAEETESQVAEAEAAEEAPVEPAAPETTVEEAEPEIAEAEAQEDVAEESTVEDAAEDTVTAEAAAPEAGADDAVALLASADLANGESVWRQCRACHVHDAEQNRGGPHLVGVIGREIGSVDGWRYSRALSEHGGVWTVDALLAWLDNPDSYIPGNQMAFRGLRNEQDRIDVLGFLNESSAN